MANGFQADSSAPFILEGTPIGKHAVWHRVVGPILSNTFAMIPGLQAPAVTIPGDPLAFAGAGCRADYSQNEIITAGEGGVLSVVVYGVRCEPYLTSDVVASLTDSVSLAHVKIGTYSILGGTNQFRNVVGGTGAVSFQARTDGSVFLSLKGHIAYPISPFR